MCITVGYDLGDLPFMQRAGMEGCKGIRPLPSREASGIKAWHTGLRVSSQELLDVSKKIHYKKKSVLK